MTSEERNEIVEIVREEMRARSLELKSEILNLSEIGLRAEQLLSRRGGGRASGSKLGQYPGDVPVESDIRPASADGSKWQVRLDSKEDAFSVNGVSVGVQAASIDTGTGPWYVMKDVTGSKDTPLVGVWAVVVPGAGSPDDWPVNPDVNCKVEFYGTATDAVTASPKASGFGLLVRLCVIDAAGKVWMLNKGQIKIANMMGDGEKNGGYAPSSIGSPSLGVRGLWAWETAAGKWAKTDLVYGSVGGAGGVGALKSLEDIAGSEDWTIGWNVSTHYFTQVIRTGAAQDVIEATPI